ncbi:hypothetical protein ACFPPF_19415 [Xenophilus aerolatus]|nr:hypothetical protein [Xenophilus aerolatus]
MLANLVDVQTLVTGLRCAQSRVSVMRQRVLNATMEAAMPAKANAPWEEPINEVRLATHRQLKGWPLHMPEDTPDARAQSVIAEEAMRWTYKLRSRKRWVGGSRARERNEEEARVALQEIGIGALELDDIVDSAEVVVRIPYTGQEEMHWESRIFPWEYVLSAATRERRLRRQAENQSRMDAPAKADGSTRAMALTVMRELQVQTAWTSPEPDPATLFFGGVRALFVECLPPELREHWDLERERARLRSALPANAEWHDLVYPTLEDLRSTVAVLRPQLIHFSGLDSHQGLRELRLYVGDEALVQVDMPLPKGKPTARTQRLVLVDTVLSARGLMVDGVMLRSDPTSDSAGEATSAEAGNRSYPRLVSARTLAQHLLASRHVAYLVSFNLWNTAARVAPMVVAERAALASVGFQDAFDDSLAEWVHAAIWTELVATGWNLPEAFRRMWAAVRELPESVDATGITLWAGAPILGGTAPARNTGPTPSTPGTAQRVRVDVKPLTELNYAVLHNAQPMFERFILECDRPDDDLRVDVEVAVHMGLETACFKRQVQMKHKRVALTDVIHVPLTASVARAAREAISSSLRVEVLQGDQVLYSDSHRLRLLPVDQWRDNQRDGRWLPSFVQPRDSAVVGAVAAAQRYVRVLRDSPSAGFEGYQLATANDESTLRGVDLQVEAVWATLLHDWRLGYINPPPSYSGGLDSQRLRMPSTVLAHKAGTCIDLALLFASCLELVDIYPVVFLLDGHALPGWWRHSTYRDEYFELAADNFKEIVEASATENSVANAQVVAWHTGKASWREVRRWIRERKLVPIETVRLTEHCGFAEAIEAGVQALSEKRDFDSMLEIVTARTEYVTPLPIREETP